MKLIRAVLLLLVLILGSTGGGAQRWLDLGFFTLQPSELAKTGIILLMALYLTRHDKAVTSKGFNKYSFVHGFFVPSLIFILVCVLVLLEDPLGRYANRIHHRSRKADAEDGSRKAG